MADGFTGMDRALERLDPARWAAGARDGLDSATDGIVRAARENLAPHRFSGRLADSVHGVVTGSGFDLELRVSVDAAAAPEAIALESGRRPGSRPPPVDVIASWLAATGGDPAAAFPIARAIGRRGLPATHWLRRAGDASRDEIATRIRTGIAGAIR